MSGEYSTPCQRCTKRNAVQRKINNERPTWVFAAATNRTAEEVRLCASCVRTVDSLMFSVARAKSR
jgi:hypothetical protein